MNNSSDKILVVARKYNDIFYAISTSEWSQCSKHYLLMITDRLDQNEYPMQHLFDKVWSVHAELSHVAILKQVFILSRILNCPRRRAWPPAWTGRSWTGCCPRASWSTTTSPSGTSSTWTPPTFSRRSGRPSPAVCLRPGRNTTAWSSPTAPTPWPTPPPS